MNQYQVLVATPGCSIGDILTANPDGSVASTDGTITYKPTAESFSVNFGTYDPAANWQPIPQQTVWTFAMNLSTPPALSVVSMPYDPNATSFVVLQQANMIFPTQDAAQAALTAMLAVLTPITNTVVQATMQQSTAQPAETIAQ